MAVAPAPELHHEVETKLEADAEYPVPDLTGLPDVVAVELVDAVELDALYLDSEDLRLARAGISLRRRTGGSDAGWHLKLPAGVGRLEVRRPLGRSTRTPPAALLALVRVHLRDAKVGPVARVRTSRTVRRLLGAGGADLAEVADDIVSADSLGQETTSTTWRELEVELVDGQAELLDAAVAALVDAGARPAGAQSKLQRALATRLPAAPSSPDRDAGSDAASSGGVAVDYLADQVAKIVAADPNVRLDTPDALHQMRVASRRLRSGLATFRPLFAEGVGEPLRAELKWLAGVLGAARDAEVMRDRLAAEVGGQPDELVVGPVQRRVDVELRATHKDAHAEVVRTLDGDRYLALVANLEDFVAHPPYSPEAKDPAPKRLRRLVRKACRRVQRAVDARDAATEPAERDHLLHEVRKAAKRARYAGEAVEPVFDGDSKATAKAMEEIQEQLGDFQDAIVLQETLRDLGMRAHLSGENGFTFGRLHALAEIRAQRLAGSFDDLWASTRKQVKAWPGR